MSTPAVAGLKGLVTGSTSNRLVWQTQDLPTTHYLVYRSVDNNFAHASVVATLTPTSYYNDYGPLTPATDYFYWVSRKLGAVESTPSGPIDLKTQAAQAQNDAMSPAQQDALFTWANDLFSSVYSVMWANEPMDKPQRPLIVLNRTGLNPTGAADDIRGDFENLSGGRIGTISVKVLTDPQPPENGRALVSITNLTTAAYTVTINGVAYATAVFGTTPTNDAVLQALQAVIPVGVARAWICGNDAASDAAQQEFLAIEAAIPSGALSVTVDGNMAVQTIEVLDAWTIAGRLFSSLGMPLLRDTLNLAGIGVGSLHPMQDLSGPMETKFEVRVQFDFFINVDEDTPLTTPIIDTVTSVDGTLNP